MPWSETKIARAMARQTFERKHLVIVPNCNWTGYECDLLVVTPDLRIIDVEVKISRADLKADAKKDKWWHRQFGGYAPTEEVVNRITGYKQTVHRSIWHKTHRTWPPKVWKHYYAMPREIWKPELAECLGSPASGVILLEESNHHSGLLLASVERRAKPCRDAEKISPAAAVDIARLASLRMWDAYERVEDMQNQIRKAAA